jgi:hypothetical protein
MAPAVPFANSESDSTPSINTNITHAQADENGTQAVIVTEWFKIA